MGQSHFKKFALISLFFVHAGAGTAAPLSYKCTYTVSIAANIGSFVQTDLREDDHFELQFAATPSVQEATMIGNLGASNVLAIWSSVKVTFIEITGNGTVQTTVVYGLNEGSFASRK